jgi:methylated-DNA-[protein]-cysteine S-methyltransferase
MFTANLSSPIGPIVVTADAHRLLSIRIGDHRTAAEGGGATSPLTEEAARQLTAWFEGLLHFFDLPLMPPSTARGSELRAAICAIGYGETASYGELARQADSGPRAIGQACRRNPFPIVVPCHRVIGAGQSIGYYSGGEGIKTKRWLINFEKKY